MIIEQFNRILERFQDKGCTFASLDAETLDRGLRRVVTNEQVILFTNKNGSGYEGKVRRELQKAGKDPDLFVLGKLPWGERIPNTPLIRHKGFYYLQTVLLKPGKEEHFLGSVFIPPERVGDFIKIREKRHGVYVHTYALENIKGIRLLGEELGDKPRPRKKILGIK